MNKAVTGKKPPIKLDSPGHQRKYPERNNLKKEDVLRQQSPTSITNSNPENNIDRHKKENSQTWVATLYIQTNSDKKPSGFPDRSQILPDRQKENSPFSSLDILLSENIQTPKFSPNSTMPGMHSAIFSFTYLPIL
ncbi:MAG: hypothetical protein OXE99_01850 [Cellvibrionales bacterium]|nr:hypothetical protein [Cellvibrionales bacterium]